MNATKPTKTIFETGAEIADEPQVTDDTALVPKRGTGQSMIERWMETGAETAMKRIETVLDMLARLRKASIAATYPSDWIIHTSKDADGNILRQVGYLQDVGAERAGKPWGISVGSPAIEREDFPDGSYSYHMLSEAWSNVTGERLEYIEGSRWSGAGFFANRSGPNEKVDPTHVRKAAYANLHGRAVRALAGLNAVPLDMLTASGIDTGKVVMIGYDKGAKGGESTGAAIGTADVTIGWGNSKGKKPSELAEKDLEYYLGAFQASIEDPDKKKWLKGNQRMLDALKTEKARRSAPKVEAPAPDRDTGPTEASTGEAPGSAAQTPGEKPIVPKEPAKAGDEPAREPTPKSRGKLISEVFDLMNRANENNQKRSAATLRALSMDFNLPKETSNLSDFTDEALSKILLMSLAEIKTFQAAAGLV
jgi:hypothetical protein